MPHSIGDGIVVASLAALCFGYLYLKSRSHLRRMEIVHQERLIAMEKDFPLPELSLDPPVVPRQSDPTVALLIGVVLFMFGAGTMIAVRFYDDPNAQKLWIMPLPVVLMGLGLILVYALVMRRGA